MIPEAYRKQRLERVSVLVLFLIAAYFPLFLQLDRAPLRAWDESLFAIRAYNLAHEGKLLDTFSKFEAGSPKHRNGKPPFFTYFQAASFKLFGYNELALRLPIALAGLLTALMIIRFFYRRFGRLGPGIFSALVLITSLGYIDVHLTRTGDHDAGLALLILATVLSFYNYLETDQRKYLWAMALATTAAVLTKSMVAFLTFPGLMVYATYKRKLWLLAKRPSTYLAATLVLALVALQYLFIEWQNPGTITYALKHEMTERLVTTIHGHRGGWDYYLTEHFNWKVWPWMFLVPVAVLLLFFKKLGNLKDIAVLLLLAAISYLVVISVAKTKLSWYDAALYPLYAMLAGLVIWKVYNMVVDRWYLTGLRLYAFSLVFVALVFGYNYSLVIAKNYEHKPRVPQENIGAFMKKLREKQPELKRYAYLDKSWNLVFVFYRNAWNNYEGYHIAYETAVQEVEKYHVVVTCDKALLDSLLLLPNFENAHIIEQDENCYAVSRLPQ